MHTTGDSMQEAAELLRSVADQLKLPLMTIARQAELALLRGEAALPDMHAVDIHAKAALNLVDSYLLGLQLLQQQTVLTLEPVSVSSMLAETAHELQGLAKQYKVDLAVHIGGRFAPVMAHRSGLKSALLSLGTALLEQGPPAAELTLAVHRTPHGIVTGIYGDFPTLSIGRWRKALQLGTAAGQPLRALSGSGAGLFVAEAILRAMDTHLRVGRHQHRQGLATTLQNSQQLSLV